MGMVRLEDDRAMSPAPLVLASLLALAVPAQAGEWEASLLAGPSFPFYDQAFAYDPGPLAAPFPGAIVEQRGIFHLGARGGLDVAALLAYHPRGWIGVEARLDTADVRVSTEGARYNVRASLPPPIGTVSSDVDLGGGEVDLERLLPVSLNLRLRRPGRVALTASGGVSYLPAFRFEVRQGVGIGLSGLVGGVLDVAQVTLGAEALPAQEGEGRWGANVGAGLQHRRGSRLLLTLEGRYFHFQPQTLGWGRPDSLSVLPAVQQEIVRQISDGLEPVRFTPTFFQATAGVGVTF